LFTCLFFWCPLFHPHIIERKEDNEWGLSKLIIPLVPEGALFGLISSEVMPVVWFSYYSYLPQLGEGIFSFPSLNTTCHCACLFSVYLQVCVIQMPSAEAGGAVPGL
jgi:hypothetical protein